MENKYKNKKDFNSTKRHADTSPLKEVINDFLNTYKLQKKYKETFLISSWENIVGSHIAAKTTQVYIQNKKMYVKLTSAPLKNELAMSKVKILALIHEALGETIIDDIFFM